MASNATCPYCQATLNVTETIGEQPIVCPHCLSNLANPQMAPAGKAPNVLRDIRSHWHGIGWLKWLLIGPGIALSVFAIVRARIDASNLPRHYPFPLDLRATEYLCPGFVILDLFVFLALVFPLWRYCRGKHPILAVERVVGFAILATGLAAAIVVFFFGVCYAVDQ